MSLRRTAPGTQEAVNMHTPDNENWLGGDEALRCLKLFNDITFTVSFKANFLNSMTFRSATFPDET